MGDPFASQFKFYFQILSFSESFLRIYQLRFGKLCATSSAKVVSAANTDDYKSCSKFQQREEG